MDNKVLKILITICFVNLCIGRPETLTESNSDQDVDEEDFISTEKNITMKMTQPYAPKIKIQNVKSIGKTSTGRMSEEDRIVFRDTSTDLPHKIVPKMAAHDECVHGICENVEGYNKEFILKIIKEAPELHSYFNKEVIDITNRFAENGETMCRAIRTVKYPQRAININKIKREIVNLEEYKQGIVMETCAEEAKCMFSNFFPNDYEVSCQQRYAIRQLVAVNDSNQPAFESFDIPSCCVCTVKKI